MPNMITVSNIADRKASSQRAVMSTTGYAYAVATDKDTIQIQLHPALFIRQYLTTSPEAKYLCTNRPISPSTKP
ncbi:MAG: hypothetical protein V7K14_21980 [Nostoc sp.]